MTPVVEGTVLHAVEQALLYASRYNRDDRVRPAAVLWPDPTRAWAKVVPSLIGSMNLFSLGEYDPAAASGPAIWIRCQLAEQDRSGGERETPVIYLPGVERADLRAIESCEPHIRPLAELQFRANWWVQSNQSPWTPEAFLRSPQGADLDLARDQVTRNLLMLTLSDVMASSISDLARMGRIDAKALGSLVVADEVRTVLEWLSDPVVARKNYGAEEWQAVVATCKSALRVDLDSDGPLTVALKLGQRRGEWGRVWKRFAEAPNSYPGIPARLRQAKPPATELWSDPSSPWPQDNEDAEDELAASLASMTTGSAAEARQVLADLEQRHGERRNAVWSQLGQAPLASALEHLSAVAARTADSPSAEDVPSFMRWYADSGFHVDAEAMLALSAVTDPSRREAVGVALRAVYKTWLDDLARRFQDLICQSSSTADVGLNISDGDCVVFIDGLRLDVGESLRSRLAANGLNAEVSVRLSTFPTMTSSGKPAVAPLTMRLSGGSSLTPTSAGKEVDAAHLRDLLAASNVQVLSKDSVGDPAGRGWTETADLDKTGHELEVKIVDRIEQEVSDIAVRVQQLLGAGWARVHVVTDHGWLLVPGRLDKVELAQHLTDVRKSRCARLSSGAVDVGQPTVPWSWDADVRIAVPRGVAAFQAGCVYEHGGISPQESITPHLIVTAAERAASAKIEAVKWIGLRCRIDYVEAPDGATADVRERPGDEKSSFSTGPKPAAGSGEARVFVDDDTLMGKGAYVIIVSASGELLAQVSTRVGG